MKAIYIKDNMPQEAAAFDQFTQNGPKGHFAQSIGWGDVKKKTGWIPERFMLQEEDGTIRCAATVQVRRLPGTGGRTLLYASRGPVMDFSDEETFAAFLKEVESIAKRHKSVFLKLDPDLVSTPALEDLFRRHGFQLKGAGSRNFEGIQPRFVFRLNLLGKTEDDLLMAMDRKTRYNIRLAEKSGVTVRLAEKDELGEFYRILQVTALRDGFGIRKQEYFEWIRDYLGSAARFYVAEYEGQIISATLAIHWGPTVWYLYGASDNAFRNKMPNYLLQWEMIRFAKSVDASMYDFRGVSGDIDNPENPLYGLYRFKKGFKGDLTEFMGEYDKVYSPFWYFLYEKAYPRYRHLRSRLRRAKEKKNRG